MPSKFRPLSLAEGKRFLLAMALGAYALALVELIHPHEPKVIGRWSWFFSFLQDKFGQHAIAIWWVIVGTFLVFLSLKKTDWS